MTMSGGRGADARERPQRILLIAYEFPPSPSPQSLRWAYLARELAQAGHEVHVLAPEHPGSGIGLPALPPGVRIHRSFPGPVMGLVTSRARFRKQARPDVRDEAAAPAQPHAPEELNWKGRLWHSGLNWKGHLFHWLHKAMALLLFPDQRAEWTPWARRRLRGLLSSVRPDVVISSHEPATTLALGLEAKAAGYRWIADLGDPVLAPYTPARWRRRAFGLERRTCERADHVIVTTAQARELLAARHGLAAARCTVLTQGFDQLPSSARVDDATFADGNRLELLYTGSFYRFRRHDALLQAVLATPATRLSIASIVVPDDLVEASRRHPESVRLLGFLPHLEALRLQRAADMLVNIGNDDPCQIPGKLYEYLGSGKPILHLAAGADDAAGDLLRAVGAGVVCRNRQEDIAGVLAAALEAKRQPPRVRDDSLVLPYSWRSIAARLDAIIRGLSSPGHRPDTEDGAGAPPPAPTHPSTFREKPDDRQHPSDERRPDRKT